MEAAVMNHADEIMDLVRKGNGTVTSRQVTESGIHRQYLTELVKKGKLELVERGVYIDPNAFVDTLYNLQSRYGKGIYSHGTALYLHNLSERTPIEYTMTFPSSYNITRVKDRNIKTYRTKTEFHQLGVERITTSHGNRVRAYNMERTLCDLVRGNSRVDREEVTTAFKEYAKRKNKDLNMLFKYAKLLRTDQRVRAYMEVLL